MKPYFLSQPSANMRPAFSLPDFNLFQGFTHKSAPIVRPGTQSISVLTVVYIVLYQVLKQFFYRDDWFDIWHSN